MSTKSKILVFIETNLRKPGWYWFKPLFKFSGGNPRFVFVSKEEIDNRMMVCRQGAGDYIGPIAPPKERSKRHTPYRRMKDAASRTLWKHSGS